MDLNNKLLNLLKEKEKIFENLLIKLFDQSIEGLNEILNEIIHLQNKHSWYNLYYYQIHNLKTNIQYIEKQYDFNINKISNEFKEEIELIKENFQLNINQEEYKTFFNEFICKIDHFIDLTTYQILLKSIFFSIGLFSSIESIHSLFTGTGVLGIIPLTMGCLINNTASEIMFQDKLKDLNEKLTFIIQNIQIKKNQHLQILNQYFNHFRVNLSN